MTKTRSHTGNPALNADTFGDYRSAFPMPGADNVMTLEGTTTKTGILLALVVAAAAVTWEMAMSAAEGATTLVGPLTWGGAIGGFLVALVIIFKKTWAPFLAPVYAILEGLFMGGISAMYEAAFEGIVPMAVGLTFGTLFALLFAYRAGFIKVTQKFRAGVVGAMGGIMLLYLAGFVLSFFGVGIPYIHGSGPIGIGFSVVVVIIAAMNLVLSFDFIDQGVQRGAPKYMEWYAGFGLLVALVWLYLEILRLLSKLQSRN